MRCLRRLEDTDLYFPHDTSSNPDKQGRKDKRDLRTKFTEDSIISQVMLEAAQDCVEAMDKEVAGLREIFARTSQEANEKLQQEKPVVSGSETSHK